MAWHGIFISSISALFVRENEEEAEAEKRTFYTALNGKC